MSNLSRRSIVASAAALPALAVPVVAASIGKPDAEIVALSSQLARAWDIGLHDACAALSIADEKVFEWKRLNPEPSKVKASDDPQKSARIDEIIAELRPLFADTQDYDADAKYDIAIREWQEKKAAFERESGHDEASAAEGAANDEVSRIIDAMSGIPACSIRGLIAKARVADKTLRSANGEPHSQADENVWSIIDDLLAMGAGAVMTQTTKNQQADVAASPMSRHRERQLRFYRDLGKRLIATREVLGISPEQAADAMGVTLKTYLKYEAGGCIRGSGAVENFCDEFQLSYNWMLTGDGRLFESDTGIRH
jgi:hypothetical protein